MGVIVLVNPIVTVLVDVARRIQAEVRSRDIGCVILKWAGNLKRLIDDLNLQKREKKHLSISRKKDRRAKIQNEILHDVKSAVLTATPISWEEPLKKWS